jgi:hypothetical protein
VGVLLFLKTPPFLFLKILFYILAKVIPGGYFMYLPEKNKIRAGFFFFLHSIKALGHGSH